MIPSVSILNLSFTAWIMCVRLDWEISKTFFLSVFLDRCHALNITLGTFLLCTEWILIEKSLLITCHLFHLSVSFLPNIVFIMLVIIFFLETLFLDLNFTTTCYEPFSKYQFVYFIIAWWNTGYGIYIYRSCLNSKCFVLWDFSSTSFGCVILISWPSKFGLDVMGTCDIVFQKYNTCSYLLISI